MKESSTGPRSLSFTGAWISLSTSIDLSVAFSFNVFSSIGVSVVMFGCLYNESSKDVASLKISLSSKPMSPKNYNERNAHFNQVMYKASHRSSFIKKLQCLCLMHRNNSWKSFNFHCNFV